MHRLIGISQRAVTKLSPWTLTTKNLLHHNLSSFLNNRLTTTISSSPQFHSNHSIFNHHSSSTTTTTATATNHQDNVTTSDTTNNNNNKNNKRPIISFSLPPKSSPKILESVEYNESSQLRATNDLNRQDTNAPHYKQRMNKRVLGYVLVMLSFVLFYMAYQVNQMKKEQQQAATTALETTETIETSDSTRTNDANNSRSDEVNDKHSVIRLVDDNSQQSGTIVQQLSQTLDSKKDLQAFQLKQEQLLSKVQSEKKLNKNLDPSGENESKLRDSIAVVDLRIKELQRLETSLKETMNKEK